MRKNIIPVICLVIAIGTMGFQVKQTKPSMTDKKSDPYAAEWQIIDSLEQQGLPRSAREKVVELLADARKNDRPAQVVKALIYRSKYDAQLNENGEVQAILNLEQDLQEASFPVRPVLQSILGELYYRYLSNNYWRLSDRTDIIGDKTDDIQTWSLEDLIGKSTDYYHASIIDDRIKTVPIEAFDPILLPGENEGELQKDLYDFLVFRAIRHFMNEQTYLTAPAYQFNISEPEAFSAVEKFISLGFETRDTQSFKLQTLRLFQDLLAKHLNDKDPTALVNADLLRLRFVYDHAVNDLKESLYTTALERLQEKYAKQPVVTQAFYHLAKFWFDQGKMYQPKVKEEYRWSIRNAKEICDQAIAAFPNSPGAKRCKNLLDQIRNKSLELSAELVNLPNTPALLLAGYSNISKAYFRIVQLPVWSGKAFSNHDDLLRYYLRMPERKRWSVNLPNPGDFQTHRVELKLPELPYGRYALLASEDGRFREDGTIPMLVFNVSEIGYLMRRTEENRTEFLVINRQTGTPMAGVNASFFTTRYNRSQKEEEQVKVGEGKTDKNGMIRPDIAESSYFRALFSKGKDTLYQSNSYSNYVRSYEPKSQLLTSFFLDRAIYRPGQTIYFKAILLEKKPDGTPNVLPNEAVTIKFLDVNGQEIDKLELRSNEYGTVNGQFIAPTSGLLGSMNLHSSMGNSYQQLQVEEYKRPKFEVNFQPLEGAYALNDTVAVAGSAKAFAGSNVDNALVRYRVVREVRFPWRPWWFYSGRRIMPPYGNQPGMEIANGELRTDENGDFSIDFVAQPDRSIDPDDKPAFVYTVYADVVDITGETQSGQKTVSLGYLSLQLDVNVPEQVAKEEEVTFALTSNNLDGQFQATTVKVEIFRLAVPDRIFVHRYWEKPDMQVLTQEEFVKDFPHFAYEDEDEPATWQREEKVFDQTVDTEIDKAVSPQASDWPVGYYLVKASAQDPTGVPITVEKYFMLFGNQGRELPSNQLEWHHLDKASYEPGEKAAVYLATAADQLPVLYEVEKQQQIVESRWLTVDDRIEQEYQVEESDRGNVMVQLVYGKYNRAFVQSFPITVPWSNKELSIEYSSFRDKLRPGQEEEWQIKVQGPKSEQVAAEVAVAMYDASLDQFAPNNWHFDIYGSKTYVYRNWSPQSYSSYRSNYLVFNWPQTYESYEPTFRQLNWFDFYGRTLFLRGNRAFAHDLNMQAAPAAAYDQQVEMAEMNVVAGMAKGADNAPPPAPPVEENEGPGDAAPIAVRKNLKETVFFFPTLKTDADGNVLISFTMNEALTRWKFLGLAHTKDLKIGTTQREIVTQKELMALPNAPRFFREGDEIVFTAKVSNMTEEAMNGTAKLELFDALSMQPVDALMANDQAEVSFSAPAGQSARLAWKLKVPKGEIMALTHRVTARAGQFSDGEEDAVPVLTNRMLVTETKPLPVRAKKTETFTLESMQEASKSSTLQHQQLALEYTSNPAWYAVQALPYLMEYPYECVEQVFNRFYANALATSVANKYPKIQRVFQQWKDKEVLVSNLAKNEELRTAMLEETPWVMQAQSEEQQRKNIGLLFDLNRMAQESNQTIAGLVDRQSSSGGFSWFPGGPESWYITQYVVEGFGHLRTLGANVWDDESGTNARVNTLLENAIGFIDRKLLDHYRELSNQVQAGKTTFEEDHLDNLAVHYLYARSFYDQAMESEVQHAVDYYLGQSEKYWVKRGIYQQGMIALAQQRVQKTEAAAKIVKSLRERALTHDELGMYWQYNTGWFWYELPIETHALMIEVFDHVAKDPEAVEELKIWLLKNKQTTHWKTTKATSAAVYALLATGNNWLLEDEQVEISFPKVSKKVYEDQLEAAQNTAEAGTGYFKVSWNGKEVDPEMATVRVKNRNKTIAWGALYWQYFEELDKIKLFKETPLKIDKQVFRENNSDTGPVLEKISSSNPLHPGDKLIVRIELRVDRDMEYVHLKDMRASALEPLNVLSRYKYQGGLGYYESTGDVATNFFFSYLPKGTYVFEYPLRVVYEGDFSNGISTIQCMYAPEFTSHTEGIRLSVK